MVSKGFPSIFKELKSMPIVKTLEKALKIARHKHGKDASIIVYDMGAMVLPKLLENKEEAL